MTHPQAAHVREQALGCLHLGSPMYGELLERLADDLDAGGPTVAVLRGHEHDPGPSGLALRLVGSLHRMVLEGRAPELAAYYPTAGGVWSSAGCDAVVAFLAGRGEEVRPLLDQAPQTNEVGRAAALAGGLLRLTARWPLPVRLWEIGASGGLNLQADRFRFSGEAGTWGDPASPVALEQAWTGVPLPVAADLRVVERGGCDVSPVDVTTEDGRLTLTAYVWPDMTSRHERLAGAIALARSSPVTVERLDAATYVDRLALVRGHLTVLWHSVMWQYVPEPTAGPGHRTARRSSVVRPARTRRSCTCTPSPRGVRPGRSTGSGSGPGPGPDPASRWSWAGWRRTGSRSPGSDEPLRWPCARGRGRSGRRIRRRTCWW